MVQLNLVSALLMGLFLAAIIVVITRLRNWRQESPTVRRPTETLASRLLEDPAAWTAVFVLLALLFGGGALVYVGAIELSEGVQQAVGMALLAAFGLVLGGYLFAGIYVSARNRGLKSAQAAAAGSWALGLLLVAAVTAKLLLGG